MTYNDLLKRIEKYPTGFQFTLPYNEMTEKQKRACFSLMKMAIDKKLVKSVSVGAGWNDDGNFDGFQNETFKRI